MRGRNEHRRSRHESAIGTLAGGIAHDFNNILAIIIGNAEMLRTKLAAGAQTSASLADILTASLRARDLVQQILTFSRGARRNGNRSIWAS